MRILDQDNDKKLDRVTLFLTKDQAEELLGDLDQLIKKPVQNHAHIDSADYNKEITICIYDENKIDEYGFNDRSKKLIQEDQ